MILTRWRTIPLAEHNWGDELSPSRQIPAAGYTAYYLNLNTTKPQRKQIVARAHVSEIAVNYGWSDFHNIPSQQFAAYWVGKLRVPASTSGLYHIEGEIGQANVRVMLNRRIILDAKGNLDHQPFRLNTGEYLLEVEYKSRWHTTEFRLDIVPAPILRNSR